MGRHAVQFSSPYFVCVVVHRVFEDRWLHCLELLRELRDALSGDCMSRRIASPAAQSSDRVALNLGPRREQRLLLFLAHADAKWRALAIKHAREPVDVRRDRVF